MANHTPNTSPAPADDNERTALMALAAAREPGTRDLADMAAEHGPAEAWRRLLGGARGPAPARRARLVDVDDLRRQTDRKGLRFIVRGDPEWPAALDDLAGDAAGPPLGLWLSGPADAAAILRDSVAVVGSRSATRYGEFVADSLAAGLAGHGLTIVSGASHGIDATACRACLNAKRPAVAFLAGGLDRLYPPGNARLLKTIASDHLLVSESPPQRTTTRLLHLDRNRLIAAAARAVVVVESGAVSGAAGIARQALSLGRPVMAVPGPANSVTSVTPHRLIRDGLATLVTSADDVLAALAAPAPTDSRHIPSGAPGRRPPDEELATVRRQADHLLEALAESWSPDAFEELSCPTVDALVALARTLGWHGLAAGIVDAHNADDTIGGCDDCHSRYASPAPSSPADRARP